MLTTLKRVCLRPTSAFSDMGPSPSLTGPGAIVFGQAVAALLTILVPALARYPHLVASSDPVSLTTAAGTVELPYLWVGWMVDGFVGPLRKWLTVALVLFVGATAASSLATLTGRRRSRVDGGDGPSGAERASPVARLRRTIALVGWGFTPQWLAFVVTGGIVVAFAAAGVELTDAYAVVTEANHPVGHAPSVPAVTILTHAVGAVCTLWSGYVWIAAVGVGCDVSRRTAAAVAVPVTTVLLYVSDVSHAFHGSV